MSFNPRFRRMLQDRVSKLKLRKALFRFRRKSRASNIEQIRAAGALGQDEALRQEKQIILEEEAERKGSE